VRRLTVGVLAASAALSGATADGAPRQTFEASFHAISLSFADPANAPGYGQPDPPRRIAISLPAGTRLALRSGAKIGSGTVSLNTGFAPPVTQIPAGVTVVAGRRQLILRVIPQGGDLSPFALTAGVAGSKLTIEVPPMCVPAYTPCHEIALDRLSLSIRKRLLRTPPHCPRSRRWLFMAAVTYRDGPVKTAKAVASCRRAGRA
jgi:hypothetical protein